MSVQTVTRMMINYSAHTDQPAFAAKTAMCTWNKACLVRCWLEQTATTSSLGVTECISCDQKKGNFDCCSLYFRGLL